MQVELADIRESISKNNISKSVVKVKVISHPVPNHKYDAAATARPRYRSKRRGNVQPGSNHTDVYGDDLY